MMFRKNGRGGIPTEGAPKSCIAAIIATGVPSGYFAFSKKPTRSVPGRETRRARSAIAASNFFPPLIAATSPLGESLRVLLRGIASARGHKPQRRRCTCRHLDVPGRASHSGRIPVIALDPNLRRQPAVGDLVHRRGGRGSLYRHIGIRVVGRRLLGRRTGLRGRLVGLGRREGTRVGGPCGPGGD